MKVWELSPLRFAEDLRELRLSRHLTQRDLADLLNKNSTTSVHDWEAGCYLPNLSTLIEICRVFKIDEVRINTTKITSRDVEGN